MDRIIKDKKKWNTEITIVYKNPKPVKLQSFIYEDDLLLLAEGKNDKQIRGNNNQHGHGNKDTRNTKFIR